MQDWILNKNAAPAVISEQNGTITLDNGLVRRVIETDGCRTVSLYNNQKEIELISVPRADFAVVVGIKIYEADAFDFISYQITTRESSPPAIFCRMNMSCAISIPSAASQYAVRSPDWTISARSSASRVKAPLYRRKESKNRF